METLTINQGRYYSFEELCKHVMMQQQVSRIEERLADKWFDYTFEKVLILKPVDPQIVFDLFEELGSVVNYEASERFCQVVADEFMAYMWVGFLSAYRELHITVYCPRGNRGSVEDKICDRLKSLIVDLEGVTKVGVDWYFTTCEQKLECRHVTEVFTDQVHDESYPCITERDEFADVDDFIRQYLEKESSVLLLMGKQGTGKTRLIRYIVKQKGLISGTKPKVLYTADLNAMSNEQMFIEFRCDSYDFMVLEDIDNQLISRKQGNDVMHKFLASSDGFLRASKKIILSTNLVIADIDEALVRKGRCFAAVTMRDLSQSQAQALYMKLTGEHKASFENKMYSVADVYNLAYGTSSNVFTSADKKVGFSK